MRKGGFIVALFLAVCGMTACDSHVVFDKYEHTPIVGWEKNDTLFFDVSPVAIEGNYRQELGLRITGTYPFMSLRLVVEQVIIPAHRLVRDTIDCHLIDRNGKPEGQGMSYYQYQVPVNDISLQQGDSLHICVRHDMKREILPGISDVGIKMTRH
jgi:gliding motility-associated lipoprotein GldH